MREERYISCFTRICEKISTFLEIKNILRNGAQSMQKLNFMYFSDRFCFEIKAIFLLMI
jgi:hypothetical protein